MIKPIEELASATAFLTRLRPPRAWLPQRAFSADDLAWAALIGAGVNALAGAVLWAAMAAGAPAGVAVLAGIGLLIMVTGALHEDGLADVADGFGAGRSRQHRLDIMRDSRIGAFGVLALILVVAVRFAALSHMAGVAPQQAVLAMIGAGALSRACMTGMLADLPPAREDGRSLEAGRPGVSALVTTGVSAGLIAVVTAWAIAGLAAMAAVLAAAAVGYMAVRHMARGKIGGQTGDVAGAVQQVSEAAMLAGLSMVA